MSGEQRMTENQYGEAIAGPISSLDQKRNVRPQLDALSPVNRDRQVQTVWNAAKNPGSIEMGYSPIEQFRVLDDLFHVNRQLDTINHALIRKDPVYGGDKHEAGSITSTESKMKTAEIIWERLQAEKKSDGAGKVFEILYGTKEFSILSSEGDPRKLVNDQMKLDVIEYAPDLATMLLNHAESKSLGYEAKGYVEDLTRKLVDVVSSDKIAFYSPDLQAAAVDSLIELNKIRVVEGQAQMLLERRLEQREVWERLSVSSKETFLSGYEGHKLSLRFLAGLLGRETDGRLQAQIMEEIKQAKRTRYAEPFAQTDVHLGNNVYKWENLTKAQQDETERNSVNEGLKLMWRADVKGQTANDVATETYNWIDTDVIKDKGVAVYSRLQSVDFWKHASSGVIEGLGNLLTSAIKYDASKGGVRQANVLDKLSGSGYVAFQQERVASISNLVFTGVVGLIDGTYSPEYTYGISQDKVVAALNFLKKMDDVDHKNLPLSSAYRITNILNEKRDNNWKHRFPKAKNLLRDLQKRMSKY